MRTKKAEGKGTDFRIIANRSIEGEEEAEGRVGEDTATIVGTLREAGTKRGMITTTTRNRTRSHTSTMTMSMRRTTAAGIMTMITTSSSRKIRVKRKCHSLSTPLHKCIIKEAGRKEELRIKESKVKQIEEDSLALPPSTMRRMEALTL